MADPEKDEEIIDLTEVVEETDAPAETAGGELSALPEPEKLTLGPIGEETKKERPEGDIQAIPEDLPREVTLPAPAEEPVKIEQEVGEVFPLTFEPSQALIQNYEEEVRPRIEGINRKAEEWVTSEGVQILERIVRGILPGMVTAILEKEVARLRGEVEGLRAEKEALKAGADQWLNSEGVKILDQGTREVLPKIAAEVLSKEVEKFRGEVEGLRQEKEALKAGADQWLNSEGVRILEQIAKETLPRIAGEVLGKEVEKISYEVEGLRAEKEALKVRSEQWLGSEGIKVLEQQTREVLPGIAAEALGKEAEKLKAEVEELRAEKEALKVRAEQWLSSDGIRILKQEAGEIFPRIAEEVLSKEIEKLKTEGETEEKE